MVASQAATPKRYSLASKLVVTFSTKVEAFRPAQHIYLVTFGDSSALWLTIFREHTSLPSSLVLGSDSNDSKECTSDSIKIQDLHVT